MVVWLHVRMILCVRHGDSVRGDLGHGAALGAGAEQQYDAGQHGRAGDEEHGWHAAECSAG